MQVPRIDPQDLFILLTSLGIAVVIGAVVWMFISTLAYSHLEKKLNLIGVKKVNPDDKPLFDSKAKISGAVSAAFLVSLTWSTTFVYAAPMLGMLFGLVISKVNTNFMKRSENMQCMKETLKLYDLVEFYVQAKYTIPQALTLAKELTPTIRPAVEKCLNSWSFSPQRAILQMGKEINIKECDILISVMNQAVALGPQRLTGVIGDEAGKLEDLRQGKIEAGINVKPLYQAAYLILPGIGFIGMLLFPLVYRVVMNMQQLNAGGGF